MLIKRDMLFTPAGKNRPLHIWLPDGYEDSAERYPVMYFFDGHNLFLDQDATYGKSWGLLEFLQSWEKPLIVVGIECGHEGNERLFEYCPYHFRGKFWGDLRGTGEQTMDFMAEELKPLIDREYRTLPSRENTAIGGSSMGGLMSLYAIVKYNSVYSKAACLSSAISPGMPSLRKDIREAAIDPDSRVYLSWGSKEAIGRRLSKAGDYGTLTAKHNLELAHMLEEKGARTSVVCQRGGAHNEASWEKQVPGFMDFLWTEDRQEPLAGAEKP